jgi:hypothetical protein
MHGPNSWPYSGASPSFAVSAQNVYSIHVNGGAKNGTKNNRNAEYEFSDSEIVLDSWEDFVFEIKWDIENKAYVNGWRRRWGQGEKQFTEVLRVTNESTLMYDWNLLVNGTILALLAHAPKPNCLFRKRYRNSARRSLLEARSLSWPGR